MATQTEKRPEYGVKSIDWLGCPHCGASPTIDAMGTCIEISCCSSMCFQKSDFLTIEERETWGGLIYSREAEQKIIKIAAERWNKRHPNKVIE